MTALKGYARLESGGLWRETPEAQRRDVIVSFGKATLVIGDSAGRALAHWSLAAVERLNGSDVPAVYAPDIAAGETLEIDDPLMIEAIETVRRGVARRRPRPRILRNVISVALVGATAAAAFLWLPGALERQALDTLPAVKRSEIGATVLGLMQAEAGAVCRDAGARTVLATLHARLFGAGSVGQIVVMPLAGADVVALPGHILVVDAGLIAEVDDPAVVAGSLLAGELVAGDPLEPILDAGGFAAVVRLLTTSDLPRDVLEDYALTRLDMPRTVLSAAELAPAFEQARVALAPFATRSGIDLGPMPETETVPVLDDRDWVRLQVACGI